MRGVKSVTIANVSAGIERNTHGVVQSGMRTADGCFGTDVTSGERRIYGDTAVPGGSTGSVSDKNSSLRVERNSCRRLKAGLGAGDRCNRIRRAVRTRRIYRNRVTVGVRHINPAYRIARDGVRTREAGIGHQVRDVAEFSERISGHRIPVNVGDEKTRTQRERAVASGGRRTFISWRRSARCRPGAPDGDQAAGSYHPGRQQPRC